MMNANLEHGQVAPAPSLPILMRRCDLFNHVLVCHLILSSAFSPLHTLHLQAAQGYDMTISFEQFKAIILGGSKDSSTFTRRELESAFVSLQSHKDARGKINQQRFKELMRSFGPKSDRETSRKQLQIIKEYSNEGSFDFHKLMQALVRDQRWAIAEWLRRWLLFLYHLQAFQRTVT